ncbi:MAG: di-trans,poly-cis-decaprenylcistransferase [Clostridiales bacterium]|nr:di-trans,poly-cis-decaprenylcistransferase [Clostridiales bacterium]
MPLQVESRMSVPLHVAVIMDGNGRWAKRRGLPRAMGHRRGLEVAQEFIDYSLALDVKYLSLFVFSTENWKRPTSEINSLFSLADKYLSRFEKFCKDRVRVVVSGEREGLPAKLVEKINLIEEKTRDFDAIRVNLCINYGGQREIVEAVKKLNERGEDITVDGISRCLYNQLPPPDIILRTGGQKRLSNYLLYQSAYAELFFTETLWPDFTKEEYEQILAEFAARTRNFGGIADDE